MSSIRYLNVIDTLFDPWITGMDLTPPPPPMPEYGPNENIYYGKKDLIASYPGDSRSKLPCLAFYHTIPTFNDPDKKAF